MKARFVFSVGLLLCVAGAGAQSITGIWRGTFYNLRDLMMGGSKYRYEVQMEDGSKNMNGMRSLNGVTYSYQTTRFYGKASLTGVWTPASKTLVLTETKMLELKIEGGGDGCLMTCYLDYRKEGDKEYLEGTYTSKNMKSGTDCGGGKVFLEKVPDSDFELEDFLKIPPPPAPGTGKVKPGQEDFLVKKPAPATNTPSSSPAKKQPPAKQPATQSQAKSTKPAAGSTAKASPPPATGKPSAGTAAPKPAAPKPAATAKTPVTAKNPASPAPKPPVTDTKTEPKKSDPIAKVNEPGAANTKPAPAANTPTAKINPLTPTVLTTRQNELVQTIATDAKTITFSFYDNGEIDGDTISVYDNGKLIAGRKGLTAKAITLMVNFTDDELEHEVVMVAENLGSIPPNTALMIVQAGSKRYTLNLSSTEKKNALVRFVYQKE
jgi:hypothetical protein